MKERLKRIAGFLLILLGLVGLGLPIIQEFCCLPQVVFASPRVTLRSNACSSSSSYAERKR
jgi:hypothetical protein